MRMSSKSLVSRYWCIAVADTSNYAKQRYELSRYFNTHDRIRRGESGLQEAGKDQCLVDFDDADDLNHLVWYIYSPSIDHIRNDLLRMRHVKPMVFAGQQ